jgi:hypothetical protein
MPVSRDCAPVLVPCALNARTAKPSVVQTLPVAPTLTASTPGTRHDRRSRPVRENRLTRPRSATTSDPSGNVASPFGWARSPGPAPNRSRRRRSLPSGANSTICDVLVSATKRFPCASNARPAIGPNPSGSDVAICSTLRYGHPVETWQPALALPATANAGSTPVVKNAAQHASAAAAANQTRPIRSPRLVPSRNRDPHGASNQSGHSPRKRNIHAFLCSERLEPSQPWTCK